MPKYYITPPGEILTGVISHPTTDDTTKQAQEILKAFALLEVSLSLVQVVAAPQLNAYHFKLKYLKDYPKIKRLLPTIKAACRCDIVQKASKLGDFALLATRTNRQPVHLKSVINSIDFNQNKSRLPVAVGISSNNKIIMLDIDKLPHLIIAGTTGSGKSILLNTVITSLLFKCTPNRCRLLMIDLKRVELAPYEGLPHLLHPIANDFKTALFVLNSLCEMMQTRYKEFEALKIKNIKETNKPHIILIIDELAELILTGDPDTESLLIRLAQLGRAAGIHLIIATQRPTRAVIPGLLAANLPGKIALKVASIRESVIILDHKGAEALTGAGDSIIKTPNSTEEERVQVAYTSQEDIAAVVEWWKTKGVI